MKKYIEIIENHHDKSNFIKLDFHYELGGYNCFTGKEKKRGYYLTIVPVERGGNLERFIAFSGVSELLQECTRKSAKAERIALEKLPAYEKMMVDYITNKYGYIISENVGDYN